MRFEHTRALCAGLRRILASNDARPTRPFRFARRIRGALVVFALLCAIAVTGTLGVSQAAAAGPWWHVTSRTVPSRIAPGGEGTIVVQAINLGNAATAGRYALSDSLAPGLTLQEVSFFAPFEGKPNLSKTDFGPSGEDGFAELCQTTATSATCSNESAAFHVELLEPVIPYDYLEMRLKVKAEAGAPAPSEGLSALEASGGTAPTATASPPVRIDDEPAPFGIEDFSLIPEEEGGEVDTRAGSHPYQLTNTLTFNRDNAEPFDPPALPRNLHFRLPPGEVGNATALPQCNDEDFAHVVNGGQANLCPGNTAIGVTVVTASTIAGEEEHFTVPVFNLTPATGEPARFGFVVLRNPVILDTAVRSGPGEDYGVTVTAANITQLANFISATTVFWGTPNDLSHNEQRGFGCLLGHLYTEASGQLCIPSVEPHPAAFLTLPTNCSGSAPFDPTLEGVSWPTKAAPQGDTFPPFEYPLQDSSGKPLSLTGCNQLAFSPTISAEPTSDSASSPSGLDFNLNFDDEGLTASNGVAQSQLKDTTVTLPEGFTINPSSGVGLGGCTPADYERETLESLPGAGCPNNSKLGTVEIETPLLTQKIHGSLFIAQPHDNPFDSLVALYIVAKNPETGILIKLAGKVTPNPVTGQLVTSFENNPQLPFDHFNFHFREGQQAPLITPPTCGTYTTQALLTPWSEPDRGIERHLLLRDHQGRRRRRVSLRRRPSVRTPDSGRHGQQHRRRAQPVLPTPLARRRRRRNLILLDQPAAGSYGHPHGDSVLPGG